jgi:uncharacterized metal-binding protein YceD (DUF177 family)
MKYVTPEFSRPLQVDRVPKLGSHEKIAADAKELLALAKRLDVPALHALTGAMKVEPWRGGGLKITGTLDADLDQVSVVTLEPFRSAVHFPFERYYLPAHKAGDAGEDDVDVIENGTVDLGEILSETLVLELDPYPRQPGEVFAGVSEKIEPGTVTPFTALSKLKAPK